MAACCDQPTITSHSTQYAARLQDDRGFRAKVTDFGLAVHMSAGETTFNKVQGTAAYLPMQVFLDQEVSQASDVYALGLVLWEMYHGLLWCHIWFNENQRRRCAPLHSPAPCMRMQCHASPLVFFVVTRHHTAAACHRGRGGAHSVFVERSRPPPTAHVCDRG